MARTLSGNLTGKAAQTARREFIESIASATGNSRADRLNCGDAMTELRRVDPEGWERWYDENVTDGSFRHIARQVWARVEAIEFCKQAAGFEAEYDNSATYADVRPY